MTDCRGGLFFFRMAEHGYRSSIDGGVVVNGKYQLCAKLGHGSFGDIYKGLSLHIEVRCVTEKRRGSSPPSQTQGLTLRLERRLASSLSMSAAVDRSCSTSLMSWHCLRATVCSTHPFFFFDHDLHTHTHGCGEQWALCAASGTGHRATTTHSSWACSGRTCSSSWATAADTSRSRPC